MPTETEKDPITMATPSTPSENPNHFDMLELDLPKSDPELPQWAALAIAAIAAILPIPPEVALAALEALLPALRERPEGAGKDACRAALRAKETEIRGARTRQAIPVVRDEVVTVTATGAGSDLATPAMRVPVVVPGSWVPLMERAGQQGLYRAATPAERRSRATPASWGVSIAHSGGNAPRVGTVTRITRANNSQSTLHVLTAIVSEGPDATIGVVRKATDDDMKPRAVEAAQVVPAGETPAPSAARLSPRDIQRATDNTEDSVGFSTNVAQLPKPPIGTTAREVRTLAEGWQGTAKLFELSAPLRGFSRIVVSVLSPEVARERRIEAVVIYGLAAGVTDTDTAIANAEHAYLADAVDSYDHAALLVRIGYDVVTAPSAVETTAPSTVEGSLADVVAQGATLAQASADRFRAEYIEPTTRGDGAPQEFAATGGTVNIPTGPSIFDRPRSERLFRVGTPSGNATTAERTRLLGERELVAGAIAADGWLQVSWTGEGSTTHSLVNDALIAIGRENDAPGVPESEYYAGVAVDAARNREYDTKRLPKRDVPDGIAARWVIGRALVGAQAARAGDAYGQALLIVDLRDDGTLEFDGDMTLATAVRANYSTGVAKSILNSRTMTPWLGQTLRRRHGAVKRGHCWYVPPGHAMAVRALIGGPVYAARVAEIAASEDKNQELPAFDRGSIGQLWGDHELMSCTTGADLFQSLTRGLTNEAEKVAADLVTSTANARTAARNQARKKAGERHGASEAFIDAEGEAAFKRATISGVVAARLLRDLGAVAARVSGYEAVLGAASVAPTKAVIASLRSTLEPLTDDTSVRGAMLEFE